MPKLTQTQIKALAELAAQAFTEQVEDVQRDYIGDEGWLTEMQQDILNAVVSNIKPVLKGAVEGLNVNIEVKDAEKVRKLEAKVEELKTELAQYKEIDAIVKAVRKEQSAKQTA